MRLAELAAASADVAATPGRLDKTRRLADLLSRVPAEEIEISVAFLSGQTRQGRIGVGAAAILAASDAPAAASPQLELREVDAAFAGLARISGGGAARDRAQALRDLFARATRDEHDFLRRLLFGELRQGALAGVLVDAIARAAGIGADRVRRAAMMAGDLGVVARAALAGGESALAPFSVHVWRPIEPMLADTADSASAAVAELGDALVDYKLDGARIQAHKSGDEVRLFSRSLRDVTAAAPEVAAIVRAFPARELILDGEAIALRPDGAPHPFQVTMRRFGRKPAGRGASDSADRTPAHHAIPAGEAASVLRLTPFFFDCLYVDGQPIIDEPLERRAAVLADVAGPTATPRILRPTPEQAEAFAREALARGHEGVMAKALASPYAAGRRGAAWRKIKQARTLDLVVLAAEWGHGRRRGWLSNLHLGARDPEHGSFVMLGKTFKGMTDEMLAWQTERLLALEIARDAYTVHVRPELVVEVAFNEIQSSPTYPGGLALRFARVKRYRTDKSAAEADTIATVRGLAGDSGHLDIANKNPRRS